MDSVRKECTAGLFYCILLWNVTKTLLTPVPHFTALPSSSSLTQKDVQTQLTWYKQKKDSDVSIVINGCW